MSRAEPRDIGINLTAAEVEAALADTLREVRRRIKINPYDGAFYILDGWPHRSLDGESNRLYGMEEPYRGPARKGDRLWVREAWAPTPGRQFGHRAIAYYAADGRPPYGGLSVDRWRSSQQMPRWASRLTLVVTGVRAELVGERWEWVVDVEAHQNPQAVR